MVDGRVADGVGVGDLLARQVMDPEAIARALASELQLPYAAPPLEADPAAVRLVDRSLSLRHRVLPLRVASRGIQVALSDPLDLAVLDDLRFQTGLRVEPVVASPSAIESALSIVHGLDLGGSGLDRGGSDREEGDEVSELRRASEAAPVVALVDLILQRADALGASDIHIEPAEGKLRVRARVDGVLREILELPERTSPGIASRLKIMAGMDIAVKRRPQDGRSVVELGGRALTLRVSTLPAQGGEKVVLRLLDPKNAERRLEELGFDSRTLERFSSLLGRGHGVILVTGPTGSGKTTTLYGALAALDRGRRNILTLEDPVEYQLPGLTQVQVHRRAGLSFATALRAVLRQDPDVIMVGELRDRETVETAMAAALTGHLVLSTLHTNDAPGAVTRLIEMGAPHYLIASGLIGVLAQRLVRRVCTECREARPPAPDEVAGIPDSLRPSRIYQPRGCARCDGVGYHGRVGIYELLVIDTRIRELIMRRASTDEIRGAARAGGLRSLGHDAWEKVRAGVTTLEEVSPLISLLADEAPACTRCGAEVRSDFMVCPGCGLGLRARCRCSYWLEEDWDWCPGCGASLA